MAKIVIVGGVAGGMSAAARLRRLREDDQIIILEKGPFVSFANCGLPYYVSGEISKETDLIVQTPESLQARFGLDVRPFHEVTAIDPEDKKVTISHKDESYTETYDYLILSPGAKPVIPPITGLDTAKNIFSLRNVPDVKKIMQHLQLNSVKQATIIGAGFIGLEMAENLSKRNIKVTIVEKAPHVLPSIDEEMAAYIEKELTNNNVTVITSKAATAFQNAGQKIILDDGSILDSDVTILSVGVRPETTIAKKAGIKVGLNNGILVNDKYQTNFADIYAIGDAIVVKQQITNKDSLISLASPANRQGRQVADNIAGLNHPNKGSIGTAIVRVFNQSAASTGINERTATKLGLNFKVIHILGKNHASYYPNATDITLKLIFNAETGKIYGAQGVGASGVDKRIDILATAIKGELTIFDLPELELTYAPPFGSAKDPVNMLGYAAMNIAEGLSTNIQWYNLQHELSTGKVLLDVRDSEELIHNGHFKNAINIPLNELRCRINELDPEQAYIITCHSGLRSYVGERILKQAGFTVENLDGAFALYSTVRPNEISRD
ncbi:FAD-dependent oxidoreductase [Ligilactobacillus sp. WILCCON 0076]|uniref:FAD-dependent oxidoreductase n=1 Tax=Ligilactobacillus ubinensis TaxID=2876789 RepID=A0A9X2FJ05_9LACO|nr:FAD-dependent oxidoreductase [Ligilactobacillus ubinensis]MCP0886637.1 FAD-dependent oxidoreductase [Ligilactobacillus ubinensis]